MFNVKDKSKGNHTIGINKRLEVHDLRIPSTLEPRRSEIVQLLSEGLEEHEYFSPFADGGSIDNPNTTSRWNITSFDIEFK